VGQSGQEQGIIAFPMEKKMKIINCENDSL